MAFTKAYEIAYWEKCQIFLKKCPFEEYGCKFLHNVSKECMYNQKCEINLSPTDIQEEKLIL